MSRPRRLAMLVASIVVLALVGCSAEASSSPGGRQTIVIHHSKFRPGVVKISAGEPTTIFLRNDDPIEHEWIVGSDEVHERHRQGTEPVHDQLPTEVTVPALSSRLTTLTFDRPGDYAFICHLPGHETYGMKGILRVLPK